MMVVGSMIPAVALYIFLLCIKRGLKRPLRDDSRNRSRPTESEIPSNGDWLLRIAVLPYFRVEILVIRSLRPLVYGTTFHGSFRVLSEEIAR